MNLGAVPAVSDVLIDQIFRNIRNFEKKGGTPERHA